RIDCGIAKLHRQTLDRWAVPVSVRLPAFDELKQLVIRELEEFVLRAWRAGSRPDRACPTCERRLGRAEPGGQLVVALPPLVGQVGKRSQLSQPPPVVVVLNLVLR